MMNAVLAFVDHQEFVESSKPLDERIKYELTVKAFPTSPKIDYYKRPNYEGLKVFSLNNYLCISSFFYANRTDRFGRPVLSAKVALIPFDSMQEIFRDIVAVGEALKLIRLEDASEEEFVKLVESRSIVTDMSRFRSLAAMFDIDFLARSISLIASFDKGKLILYYSDIRRAYSFIRVAFSLLPLKVIVSKTLTTECEPSINYCDEDIVFLPFGVSEKNLLEESAPKTRIVDIFSDIVRKLINRKKSFEIDLVKNKTGKGKYEKLFKIVLEELIDGEEWYTISWNEKYNI